MDGVSLLLDLVNEIIIAVVLVVPTWRIFRRAGFSGIWSLLLFIPFVGLTIAMLLLAFREWPKVNVKTGAL